MLKVTPSPERVKLGFAEAVRSAFDFLIADYSFRCVKSDMTFVRYESPDVFVNVYHGRASYEIGVEIGLVNNPWGQAERSFTIRDIVEFNGAEKETGYTRVVTFSANDPALVKKFVNRLADFVKIYAVQELRGNLMAFEQLRSFVESEAERYEKEQEISQIKREANKAWQQKNYVSLVKLYEQIEESLTPAEAKKMEYAKRHLTT
jgi:hypothetical protein